MKRTGTGGAQPAGHSRYDPLEVQARWRERWEAEDAIPRLDPTRDAPAPKFYNLVEFPYPSAEGLHVGHVYTYSGADTMGRYLRMRGRIVFQPMGFDSFGIHTENYALKVGENPRSLTDRTIIRYREQLRRLGGAWDWDREIVTSDPAYYRWTQWLFLQLYRAGLAVRRSAAVVWCPSCLTVLAHEQVEGDRCERCTTPVTERVMEQWFLRITGYADGLLERLEELDWPELAVRGQREWIGRSVGVEIDFPVEGSDLRLTAFTTRPDTLFGATFVALAPEHPAVQGLIEGAPEAAAAVRTFVERATSSALVADRTRPSGGASTGRYALSPADGRRVPIAVAGYVVGGYGTGVVMGVPAHDERDDEFAREMGLPVVQVVERPEGADQGGAWTGDGTLVASGPFTGLPSDQARDRITEWLQANGSGRRATTYRLHDWLISRQRYWGPPIPIVYCDRCGIVPVPEEDLPVLLPDVEEFRPTGTGLSPLAAVESFVRTACPSCGGPGRRETDVSDTFLDSAWYFLRFPSSDVDHGAWDDERTGRTLPVDLYAGGREHVMRHHLYARFVTAALHDLGLVPFVEPFPRIRLHGLLISEGAKMSKSRGNVVSPDHYLSTVGADNLRMYLLFCGPWEEGGDFSDRGLEGIVRFTARVWRMVTTAHPPGPGGVDLRTLDRTIAAVGRDIERLKFNTAISALMEGVRWARATRASMSSDEWARTVRTLTLLIAPFAPHLAEELWSRMGGPYSVHAQPWPDHDPAFIDGTDVTVVVQVDGRVRDRLTLPRGSSRDATLAAALDRDRVRAALDGHAPARVVHVPDRLISLVTERATPPSG